MRKTMLNRLLAFMLTVVMLTATCIASGNPGSMFAIKASAAETAPQYALDVTASVNPNDSSIIDVVITAKNFKQELLAVEFLLNFDSTKVEGVLTQYEEMDAFMTTVPTYIFSYGSVVTILPSFEQICYYDAENSRYEMRFCDLLTYPMAQPGQNINCLSSDGELVITVPFKILDGVKPGTEIEFSVTQVKGTTNSKDGLNSVPGLGDSAVVSSVSAKKFDINKASLNLGNALTLYFYIPADGYADWTGCYAVITKPYANSTPTATVTVPFEDWEPGYKSGGQSLYRVAFNGIAAKEMSDTVTIQVFNAKGEAISNVGSESIRSYLLRLMETKKNDTVSMRMAVDMLNYGAAAQKNWSYNLGNLANAGLTNEQKAFGTTTTPVCTNRSIKGTNARGMNLTLESNILINVYFNGLTKDMTARVTFTNHNGTKVDKVLDAHDGSRFTVNQLVIADAHQLFTVTVYNANGSVYSTYTDSIEGYLARARESQASSLPLYEAIMKFADSAYAYLHK